MDLLLDLKIHHSTRSSGGWEASMSFLLSMPRMESLYEFFFDADEVLKQYKRLHRTKRGVTGYHCRSEAEVHNEGCPGKPIKAALCRLSDTKDAVIIALL